MKILKFYLKQYFYHLFFKIKMNSNYFQRNELNFYPDPSEQYTLSSNRAQAKLNTPSESYLSDAIRTSLIKETNEKS